jgi:nicotinamidase-related amidase
VKPAVIVVDLLEDNCRVQGAILPVHQKMILSLTPFLRQCRAKGVPVVFACDSYLAEDFIFKGRMKPISLRGTPGANVLAEIEVLETDIVLPKRRFSAFFKTDLDQTLRVKGVDTVAVAGINTHFCVLATAFDALSHDFFTVILEDLSGAFKREIHQRFIDAYRESSLYPLLTVLRSDRFLESF